MLTRFLGREQAAATSELDVDCRNAPAGDREVAMSENSVFQIDVEAAKALICWKSLFADEVAARARQLAAESSQPQHVTLSHYRQAAQIALHSLSAAILEGGPSSANQKAA
jgi:hypothetical protein